MSKFAVLIVLLGHIWATFSQNDGSEEIMDVFRLPLSTKPESYDLFLIPTIDGLESSFCGEVKIIIVAIESTDTITLNVNELDITKVIFSEFNGQSNKEIKVIEQTTVSKNQQFVIKLESAITLDKKYMIQISFSGNIRTDGTGFFIESYIEDKVKKYVQIDKCYIKTLKFKIFFFLIRWLAVSKFEGPYARSAFPCYDEPALKAVFNISIVKPKDLIVLSNMPIKESVKGYVIKNICIYILINSVKLICNFNRS